MDMSDLQIPPPANEVKFEALCLALFRAEWADPLAQRNGRRGQEQAGVDIFGINHAQDGKQWGVQCKCKDARLGKTLSASEVDGELALADGFTPPLAHFIIATTAANDAKIQQHVRALNAARQGKFPVTVFSWEVLQDLLVKHPAVANQFYGNGWLPKVAAFHLPEMRLSPHFSDPLNHLAELRRQLMMQKSAAVLAATTVQGMGGVGKTQLALK